VVTLKTYINSKSLVTYFNLVPSSILREVLLKRPLLASMTWCLEKHVVTVGVGWKWFRIVSVGLLLATDHTIAQKPNCRFHITLARIRVQVRSCGICGGQIGTGEDFLRVFRFPFPVLIPPTAPQSSVNRSWYSRPTSGRRSKWTLSPQNKLISISDAEPWGCLKTS
jgi:hypothetical protein